jgi:hypothetical protein
VLTEGLTRWRSPQTLAGGGIEVDDSDAYYL